MKANPTKYHSHNQKINIPTYNTGKQLRITVLQLETVKNLLGVHLDRKLLWKPKSLWCFTQKINHLNGKYRKHVVVTWQEISTLSEQQTITENSDSKPYVDISCQI